MVLLELITGRTAVINSEEGIHILHWLIPELQRGDIRRIVDPRLELEAAADHDDHECYFQVNSVLKALQVAMACTTCTSHQRPTMDQVVSELKQCLDILMRLSTPRPPPTPLPSSTTTTISEEMYMMSCSYASSYITNLTDSVNAESMTAPFPR